MSSLEKTLRQLPYFADLSRDRLDLVCAHSKRIHLASGVVMFEEGSESREMYVVVDGEVVVTRCTAARVTHIATLGRGEVVGEMALLDDAPRTATVRTTRPSTLIEISARAFEELLGDPSVVRLMFRTVTTRLRGMEETLRHDERMVALGRMAAQLTHELINPAAAVERSSRDLVTVYEELGRMGRRLVHGPGESDPHAPLPTTGLSSIERVELEEDVSKWLFERDVSGAGDIAAALVDRGWTPQLLSDLISDMDRERALHFVRWTGLVAAGEQLVDEIALGAERISDLALVIKDYSFLGQAPVQKIDPASGIRNTLILLKHKLERIEVVTVLEEGVATVEAPGRALNQLWSNLIDNAADAMPEGGTLTITGSADTKRYVVKVTDSGVGIPVEAVDKIFDPFFTTKEPGKGVGLGLHTAQKIINRMGGEIKVRSSAGGTTVEVSLPTVT